MEDIARYLDLDPSSLGRIRAALSARVGEGLRAPGHQVAALPAFLPPPPPGLAGEAIVVDTGGTHVRAARVRLEAHGKHRILAGPAQDRVPRGEAGETVTRERFFDVQARLVARLSPPPDLPVGYCFSYPAEILPDGDARLLRWTKGLRIEGVEGTRVGRGLRAALERFGVRPGGVTVLNDTVAALVAGAWNRDEHDFTIGLIVGTGTNMAAFFPTSALERLDPATRPPGRMAVNLESGNFHPPHLTRWDDELDRHSTHPGRQRLEKAVSGHYLPLLARQVLPHLDADRIPDAAALSALARRSDPSAEAAVATALLHRSADLVAACLAGLVDCVPGVEHAGILAEGSLFWKAPGYARRTRRTLAHLLEGGPRFEVFSQEDTNLVGSACAALQAARKS